MGEIYTFPGDAEFIQEAIDDLGMTDVTPSQVRVIKPFTEFTSLTGQAFHNKTFTLAQRKDILAEAVKRAAVIRVASKAAELIAARVEAEAARIPDDAEAETTPATQAVSTGRQVSSLKMPINKTEQDLLCLSTLGKIKVGDVLAVGDEPEAEHVHVQGVVSRSPAVIRVARGHAGTSRRNAPEGTSILLTDQKPSD